MYTYCYGQKISWEAHSSFNGVHFESTFFAMKKFDISIIIGVRKWNYPESMNLFMGMLNSYHRV